MDQFGYNPYMMGNMMSGMPGMEQQQQPELTEEQKAEMERQRKEAEKRARKSQIENLKKQLKTKNVNLDVMEKSLAKLQAEKDLMTHVNLNEAENEWEKKAIQASIEESEAIIVQAKSIIENEKEEMSNMESRLKNLEEQDKNDDEASTQGESKADKNYL